MSPEQARGQAGGPAHRHLGFRLLPLRMLERAEALHGETVSDTLVAVLTRSPDWARSRHMMFPAMRRGASTLPHKRRATTPSARRRCPTGARRYGSGHARPPARSPASADTVNAGDRRNPYRDLREPGLLAWDATSHERGRRRRCASVAEAGRQDERRPPAALGHVLHTVRDFTRRAADRPPRTR